MHDKDNLKGISQTDFWGHRRFVRAADPLYRES